MEAYDDVEEFFENATTCTSVDFHPIALTNEDKYMLP